MRWKRPNSTSAELAAGRRPRRLHVRWPPRRPPPAPPPRAGRSWRSTRSMSRRGANRLPTVPMPRSRSIGPGCRTAAAARSRPRRRSMTWLTASAMIPITVRSPSRSTSTMTTQVRLVTRVAARPNFTARSTTGTTLPRRLMTPRMHGGASGTRVTVSYSMISRTREHADRVLLAGDVEAQVLRPRRWPVSRLRPWQPPQKARNSASAGHCGMPRLVSRRRCRKASTRRAAGSAARRQAAAGAAAPAGRPRGRSRPAAAAPRPGPPSPRRWTRAPRPRTRCAASPGPPAPSPC